MAARTLALAVATIMFVAVAVAPAAAGGWWSSIQLDPRPVGIGERATATAHVLFSDSDTLAAARDGDVAYYAYLVRGIDQQLLDDAMRQPEPERWWTRPHETILLAEITLDQWDSNLARATATFTIPDIAPGVYGLMFCDHGCTRPLADVVPLAELRIADALSAHLARELAATATRDSQQLERLTEDLRTTRQDLRQLQGQLDDLATNLPTDTEPDIQTAAATSPAGSSWPDRAGWLVAGLAIALTWTRHRRPDLEPAPTMTDGHPGADDAPAPELVTWR